jgi:long-chain acyl-CoA synthetase
MSAPKLILDYVYAHESNLGNQVFLTQPMGGGQVVDYTWAQTLDQARRMAAHLQSLRLPPAPAWRCWPRTARTSSWPSWPSGWPAAPRWRSSRPRRRQHPLCAEHSEASLLFIGKLDTWDRRRPASRWPALHRPAAGAARWPTVARPGTPSSRAPAAARSRARRRTGDAALHVGLHRSAQGRDADLRQHHREPPNGIRPTGASGWADSRRAHAVLPAAGAQLRARRGSSASPWSMGAAHVTSASRWHLHGRPASARSPPASSRCPGCGPSSSRRCSRRCRRQLDACSLANPGAWRRGRQEGAGRAGAGCRSCSAGSGSAPIPPDLMRWYRKPGPGLYEGYA